MNYIKFDIDRYREIIDTLTRNKTRSFLTGFGVFWGVFMLVVLLGGGQGLKEMLGNNFDGFANNAAFAVPSSTTKPYNGLGKGRSWSMVYNDVERLKSQVPGLDVVTPVISKWGGQAVNGDKKFSGVIDGVLPDHAGVEAPMMYYGRWLNSMDVNQSRKVCVLGKKVYKNLFPAGGNPCGHKIRIDNIYYDVVGVNYYSSDISLNGRGEEKISIPLTVMQKAYNKGDTVDFICLTGKPGVVMSDRIPLIRDLMAKAHNFDKTDEKALLVVNTEVMFGLMDNLFTGVNFLILLVGIGTLLAGSIGVSNIMMVTVRERTTEIGIRRAIGATPKNILGQIIAESVALTSVAGMSGILFAVGILELIELGNTTDGIIEAHFQVRFLVAVSALALLVALGVLAGLAPALRAMGIKPVDAMRDE